MNTFKEIQQVFTDTVRLFKLTWHEKGGLLIFTGLAVCLASLAPFVQHFAVGEMVNELVAQRGSDIFSSTESVFVWLFVAAGLAFVISNILQFFFKTVLYKELFHFLTVLIHKRVAELDTD